jgi:hypothetical protein
MTSVVEDEGVKHIDANCHTREVKLTVRALKKEC